MNYLHMKHKKFSASNLTNDEIKKVEEKLSKFTNVIFNQLDKI